MAEEAEIISLAPEPRLCYYFVTTETTLDGYLLDHWSNVIEEIPEDESELRSRKNNLRDLVEYLSLHDIVAGVFSRLPSLEGEDFMSDEFEITQEEIFKAIEKEKALRLQAIIDGYREYLEREQIVGVFISDVNDQFREIYVPRMYSNPLEVTVEINRSIGKIMTEVMQKYPSKKIRKAKPGEILVASVTVGTEIDKRVIENWLKVVQDDTNFDLELKNKTIELLDLQLKDRIAVIPFNSLPNIGQGDALATMGLDKLTKEQLLVRIDEEKARRVQTLGENFFKPLIVKSKRKAAIIVVDYDYAIHYQIIRDGLKETDHERILSELEERNDMIIASLQDLKESEAHRKALQFKEEALGVLHTHIERQKTALIPELDIYTTSPRPKSTFSRTIPTVVDVGPESDLIDFSSPKKNISNEQKTPEAEPKTILDLLAFKGPIITPQPKTRRKLEHDYSMQEPVDLLDTTPPILIMARPPIVPEKLEWWDAATERNEILEPIQPMYDDEDMKKPVKSFMEAASDWIKHAQVTLSQRETKAGIDLWSDILAASASTDPVAEPKIPGYDEKSENEEVEEKEDVLVGL